MARVQDRSNRKQYFATTVIGALCLVTLIICSVTLVKISNPHEDINALKSNIVLSIQNMNSPVPREVKTGTYYLPGGHFAIPNVPDDMRLTYNYNSKNGVYGISTVEKFNNNVGRLISNSPMADPLNALPRLECEQRGVRLSDKPFTEKTFQANQTVKTLADGRTVYISAAESYCAAGLQPIVDLLKNIQSY